MELSSVATPDKKFRGTMDMQNSSENILKSPTFDSIKKNSFHNNRKDSIDNKS
jgi:hypothetical protein